MPAVRSARHVGDICVKAAADDICSTCQITGIAALPENRLVVTDSSNNAVKLVKVNLNKVISRLALSSGPLDVTSMQPNQEVDVQPNQVAVSLGNIGKIEIFTVTETLTRTKTIQVPVSTFSGICYDMGRFIVVSESTHDVRIVDQSGNIVSTVSKDSYNDPLFKSPRYITSKIRDYRGETVIFVTDQVANTVTNMTLDGHIDWVYRHFELQFPSGIAFTEGDIIVCGSSTGVVQLLPFNTGLLTTVLLDKERGLAPQPQALCVFKNKIWVSSTSRTPVEGDFLRMFQWEYTTQ